MKAQAIKDLQARPAVFRECLNVTRSVNPLLHLHSCDYQY